MYRKIIYHCRHGKQVTEFHDNGHRKPGELKRQRQKLTKEQAARKNQKTKERRCERLLMENFDEGDYYFTLTYRKEERPEDMAEAKKDLRKLIRTMRRAWKKAGAELKYIYNIELGKKGGWHIHMVATRILDGDAVVSKAWKQHGGCHTERMYLEGGFLKLAQYITKSPYSDNDDGSPKPKESGYGHSQNLREPKREDKEYVRRRSWGDIKVPKGWYVDQDSIHEGINPVTGWPYRRYVLLRLDERGPT